MCTRVLWPDAGGSVLVGRNMDFARDLETNLWLQPRGIERSDGIDGDFSWTSKYGSIVAACMDIMTADGINEAGFAGNLLWLAESDYGVFGDGREGPALAQSVWLQYFLDTFATVAEAVEWIETSKVGIYQVVDPGGGKAPALHLSLEDATGDSAVIEYVDGEAKIYHGHEYLVMTNSPTYDQQLELVKKVDGLGGNSPLPGGTDARDRFARALFYEQRLPQPNNQVEAVASLFSVMRNVAQPFRTPDLGSPEASQTIWQTVADLTKKRYVYSSTTAPNIVWVDFEDMDFSEGTPQLKLDLMSDLALEGSIAGNVSNKFVEAGQLQFFTKELSDKLAAAAANS